MNDLPEWATINEDGELVIDVDLATEATECETVLLNVSEELYDAVEVRRLEESEIEIGSEDE